MAPICPPLLPLPPIYHLPNLTPPSASPLSPAFWDPILPTSPLVDISTDVTPRFLTTAKMAYDKERVYFRGDLAEPNVWANLTSDQTVIFQDNDFEIFLDVSKVTKVTDRS